MKRSSRILDIDFAGPATYRIAVEGNLESSYSDRLAGMVVSVTDRHDRKPVTSLEGTVLDQAELNGVLATLYSLHLSILSVEQIRDDG